MDEQLKLNMQLQVREAGVINGFCYPYARLLLDRLTYFQKKSLLFVLESDEASHSDYRKLQDIVEVMGASLAKQIEYFNEIDARHIDELIDIATRFLAIFESKK